MGTLLVYKNFKLFIIDEKLEFKFALPNYKFKMVEFVPEKMIYYRYNEVMEHKE